MRILLVHNHYRQPGGEDQAFAAEGALLAAYGHRVVRYTLHNDQAEQRGRLRLMGNALWNNSVFHELRGLIQRERPHIVHFHNTFPLISPSAYYAARAERVPVVQTLHNYRLLCLNGLFFRNGRVCEDCLGRAVWPGVVHASYRGSRAASGLVAAVLTVHRALGTWTRMVNIYIALTEFARQKFIQGGLPAEKIVLKPHFVSPDPGPAEMHDRSYALFVGRLSAEKGVDTMLAAWEKLAGHVPLNIVGDGPLAPRVAEAAKHLPGVRWLGQRPPNEVHALMGEAALLVVPSLAYETFGRVAIEAFARGTPVIAPETGAIAELVDSGRTGLHCRPGDPENLAARVAWLWSHPGKITEMGREARYEFERKYTAERNYQMLMQIYTLMIGKVQTVA